jgi:hypothetical protein
MSVTDGENSKKTAWDGAGTSGVVPPPAFRIEGPDEQGCVWICAAPGRDPWRRSLGSAPAAAQVLRRWVETYDNPATPNPWAPADEADMVDPTLIEIDEANVEIDRNLNNGRY